MLLESQESYKEELWKTLCGFNNKTHGLHSLVRSAKLKTKHPLVNQVK